MGAFPLPNYHVNPPADPAEQMQRALSVRGMIQQQQLGQQLGAQAVQSGQLNIQKEQLEMQDRQAMTAAMREWAGLSPAAGAAGAVPLPGAATGTAGAVPLPGERSAAQTQSVPLPGAATAPSTRKAPSMNDLADLMVKHGVSGAAVLAVRKQALELEAKASEVAKNDAETGSKNIETVLKKNDLIRGALNTVNDAPDEQFVPRMMSTAQGLAAQGLLDPQHMQMVQQLAQMPPAQARQSLLVIEKALASESQQYEIAQKAAQVPGEQAKSAQAVRSNAASILAMATTPQDYATKLATIPPNVAQSFPKPGQWTPNSRRQILQAGMTPEQAMGTPGIQDIQDYLSANNLQDTAKNRERARGAIAARIPAARVSIENAGVTGTPGQPSAIAQGLAAGSIQWKDVVTNRTPMSVKEALLKEVKGINPQFNSGDFQVEMGVRQKFISGTAADQLAYLNTADQHLTSLRQAAVALQNGDVKLLNQVANQYKTQVGSTPLATYNAINQVIGGDVNRAVSATGTMAEGEMQTVRKVFDPAAPLKAQVAAIDATKELISEKRKVRQQQYEQGMQGRPNFGGQPTAPQHAPGATANLPEGATGQGSDGKKYVVKGGVWVPQ